jgi:hypothetical protein
MRGMQESNTSVVAIPEGPGEVLRKIVHFMYCGRIEIQQKEFAPVLHCAEFCDIRILKSALTNFLDAKLHNGLLLDAVRQCDQEKLSHGLLVFIRYIATFFDESPLEWSKAIDIGVFAEVTGLVAKPMDVFVAITNAFLDEHSPDE